MSNLDKVLQNLDEVKAWCIDKSCTLTALDYAQLAGSAGLFIAYAELLSPSLVSMNGRVYLSSGFDVGNYEQWKEKLSDERGIQKVMNHLHISSFMQNGSSNAVLAEEIALRLKYIWSKTMPDDVIIEIEGVGSIDLSITFFQ